jgi:hypothetical protein
MPELGTRPANQYLPRQVPQGGMQPVVEPASAEHQAVRFNTQQAEAARRAQAVETEAHGLFARLFGAVTGKPRGGAAHTVAE